MVAFRTVDIFFRSTQSLQKIVAFHAEDLFLRPRQREAIIAPQIFACPSKITFWLVPERHSHILKK